MASRGLGKGLDTLIPVSNNKVTGNNKLIENEQGPVSIVSITKVEPNRDQPRKTLDEGALQELAESIKQFGLFQPILVQDRKNHYEIITGERRWRASMIANLKEVPVIIKK